MKRRSIFRVLLSISCVFIFLFISTCTIDTFKDFFVVSVSVSEDGVIGTEKQELKIVFSKDVDEDEAQEFIRIESSSGEFSVRLKVSGKSVRITPEETWAPFERYWLIVSKMMKDAYGKEMGKDFYYTFRSTDELIPVSAVLVWPEIIRGIVESEVYDISIAFSSDVDRNSVEREFSLSPAEHGYFEWTSDRSFLFHLTRGLEKNQFYTLRISGDAKDQNSFGIKSFMREFEYWPNQEYPEIHVILAGDSEIFNAEDPVSFNLEEGNFIIEYPEAEKDMVLRIDFSTSIDKSTFKDNFFISPYGEWHEEWISGEIVKVVFDENLALNEHYEITINKGIKDEAGLGLLYGYKIYAYINGENSQYILFYADNFLFLEIDAVLTGDSGIIAPENYQIDKDRDDEGYFIEIMYTDATVPEDIEIEFIITLRFTHPYYTPVLDESSLQDSTVFKHIFGDGGDAVNIGLFDWEAGGKNECQVHISGIGNNNIYCFSINGGKGGVTDEQENYMENDVEHYFKVKLIQNIQ